MNKTVRSAGYFSSDSTEDYGLCRDVKTMRFRMARSKAISNH